MAPYGSNAVLKGRSSAAAHRVQVILKGAYGAIGSNVVLKGRSSTVAHDESFAASWGDPQADFEGRFKIAA